MVTTIASGAAEFGVDIHAEVVAINSNYFHIISNYCILLLLAAGALLCIPLLLLERFLVYF